MCLFFERQILQTANLFGWFCATTEFSLLPKIEFIMVFKLRSKFGLCSLISSHGKTSALISYKHKSFTRCWIISLINQVHVVVHIGICTYHIYDSVEHTHWPPLHSSKCTEDWTHLINHINPSLNLILIINHTRFAFQQD